MKYLRDNNSWNDEDFNWDIIEISKVDKSIIQQLVKNIINLDLSDEFYISFESLLKLGKRAEPIIRAGLEKLDYDKNFKKSIFKFLLDFTKNKDSENPFISQLYNPDFITRAKAIHQLRNEESEVYLNYLIPLLNDPDDSVRWAIINLLLNSNHLKNQKIAKLLENHIKVEVNPVIQEKLNDFFNSS